MEREAMQAIIEEKNKIMHERAMHSKGQDPPSSEVPNDQGPATHNKKKKKKTKKTNKGKKRATRGKKKRDVKKGLGDKKN